MNESDKNRLRISYRDIGAKSYELFHLIEDGGNVCMSMYVKIRDIHDYIYDASDLFEVSAVSEYSDYKRFYVHLREQVQDLHEHVGYVEREISVDSAVKKEIESLFAVVLRDEALFGYSEKKAKEESDEEIKPVSGSYFTQYDFTLPVSLGSQNE